MFYCEINKDGLCYHSTISELPVSDTIILSEEDKIGMIWDGEKWNEPKLEILEEPTQEELLW